MQRGGANGRAWATVAAGTATGIVLAFAVGLADGSDQRWVVSGGLTRATTAELQEQALRCGSGSGVKETVLLTSDPATVHVEMRGGEANVRRVERCLRSVPTVGLVSVFKDPGGSDADDEDTTSNR